MAHIYIKSGYRCYCCCCLSFSHRSSVYALSSVINSINLGKLVIHEITSFFSSKKSFTKEAGNTMCTWNFTIQKNHGTWTKFDTWFPARPKVNSFTHRHPVTSIPMREPLRSLIGRTEDSGEHKAISSLVSTLHQPDCGDLDALREKII